MKLKDVPMGHHFALDGVVYQKHYENVIEESVCSAVGPTGQHYEDRYLSNKLEVNITDPTTPNANSENPAR